MRKTPTEYVIRHDHEDVETIAIEPADVSSLSTHKNINEDQLTLTKIPIWDDPLYYTSNGLLQASLKERTPPGMTNDKLPFRSPLVEYSLPR